MSDEFADAVARLEDEVDRAVNRAIDSGLSAEECANELRRIAQSWIDSQ